MALNVSEPIPVVTDVSSSEKLKHFFLVSQRMKKTRGRGRVH